MKKLITTLMLLISVNVYAGNNQKERYGAIAFSKNPNGGYAWGIAWSYGSLGKAQQDALNVCRSEGGFSCTSQGWFRNACGALAIGDGNGFGTGWGDSRHEAQQQALYTCRKFNQNCRNEIARCAD